MTRGGKRFYITFIDDYSKYIRMYLLRNKDEAMDAFIKYKNEVENQLSKKIKRLRSDRGGEYESNPFNTFCEEHGIIHEIAPPYSPESNGVVMSLKVIYFQSIFLIDLLYKKTYLYARIWNNFTQSAV